MISFYVPASELGLLVEGPAAPCEFEDCEDRCFRLLVFFVPPLFGSISEKKGFTIVMSFCLASEKVEARLLFQVIGLGALLSGKNCVYSILNFHRYLVPGLRSSFGKERRLLFRSAAGNRAHVYSCLTESLG